MKQNLTELVFILDKSGSMSGLEDDTIGGYNSLIEKQKKEEGEAVVSTVLFSDKIDVIRNRVGLDAIDKLTDKEYFVSGCTALLDAIGSSIQHIKKVHMELKEDEVPGKTLFVITTDGMENASREYSYEKIKSLIEKQKESGWEFIFLGANIDAATEASRFGIDSDKAVNYNCDADGVNLNYEALDCAITSVRTTGSLKKSWRRKIDADFEKRGKGNK